MSLRDRGVLTVLTLHADSVTWDNCFPDQDTIAEEIGAGRPKVTRKTRHSGDRSVRNVLNHLEGMGLITRQPRKAAWGQFPGTDYALAPSAILAVGNSCRRQELAAPSAESAAAPSAESADKLPKGSAQGTAQGPPPLANEPSKAKRRKPETPVPAGFVPDEEFVSWASKEFGFDRARVTREIAKFVDHALTTDRRARDWAAAARGWLRKAKDFDERGGIRRAAAVQQGGYDPEKSDVVRKFVESRGPRPPEGAF